MADNVQELERVKSPESGEPERKTKPKKPSMYHVVLLNDDYTPMEFVVMILERLFSKPQEEAVAIMLEVHKKGKAIAGTYTFEVAETKIIQLVEAARSKEYPLLAVPEKAD